MSLYKFITTTVPFGMYEWDESTSTWKVDTLSLDEKLTLNPDNSITLRKTYSTFIKINTFNPTPNLSDDPNYYYETGEVYTSLDGTPLSSQPGEDKPNRDIIDQITGVETEDAEIFRLYNAAFGRLPDASGLSYWIHEYTTGVSDYKHIARSFLDSEELKSRYGANNTNEDFVNNLYKNVLGRLPDSEGLDYWVTCLDTGVNSRVDVLGGFSESTENKNLFSKVTGIY